MADSIPNSTGLSSAIGNQTRRHSPTYHIPAVNCCLPRLHKPMTWAESANIARNTLATDHQQSESEANNFKSHDSECWNLELQVLNACGSSTFKKTHTHTLCQTHMPRWRLACLKRIPCSDGLVRSTLHRRLDNNKTTTNLIHRTNTSRDNPLRNP